MLNTDEFSRFLVGDEPASMKELCLKLLLILCTGMENVSQNTLMEYLMMNSIFESLAYLLSIAGTTEIQHWHALSIGFLLKQIRNAFIKFAVRYQLMQGEFQLMPLWLPNLANQNPKYIMIK